VTYYIPGPLLNVGKNELIMLELEQNPKTPKGEASSSDGLTGFWGVCGPSTSVWGGWNHVVCIYLIHFPPFYLPGATSVTHVCFIALCRQFPMSILQSSLVDWD
jgi:hypothetical protein